MISGDLPQSPTISVSSNSGTSVPALDSMARQVGDQASCQSQPFSRAHSIVEVSECGCVWGGLAPGGTRKTLLASAGAGI